MARTSFSVSFALVSIIVICFLSNVEAGGYTPPSAPPTAAPTVPESPAPSESSSAASTVPPSGSETPAPSESESSSVSLTPAPSTSSSSSSTPSASYSSTVTPSVTTSQTPSQSSSLSMAPSTSTTPLVTPSITRSPSNLPSATPTPSPSSTIIGYPTGTLMRLKNPAVDSSSSVAFTMMYTYMSTASTTSLNSLVAYSSWGGDANLVNSVSYSGRTATIQFVSPYVSRPYCIANAESYYLHISAYANTTAVTIELFNADGTSKAWSSAAGYYYLTCVGERWDSIASSQFQVINPIASDYTNNPVGISAMYGYWDGLNSNTIDPTTTGISWGGNANISPGLAWSYPVMQIFFWTAYAKEPVCFIGFENVFVHVKVDARLNGMYLLASDASGNDIAWQSFSSWMYILCFGTQSAITSPAGFVPMSPAANGGAKIGNIFGYCSWTGSTSTFSCSDSNYSWGGSTGIGSVTTVSGNQITVSFQSSYTAEPICIINEVGAGSRGSPVSFRWNTLVGGIEIFVASATGASINWTTFSTKFEIICVGTI